jgi:tryptophan synthase beta chain
MSKGRYGIHGGQYIPETLMNELIRLEESYEYYKKDAGFTAELEKLLNEYAGRPSLLYYAEKMTKDLGGAKIYLKREDLNHTGSHRSTMSKARRCCKEDGKTRLIAEPAQAARRCYGNCGGLLEWEWKLHGQGGYGTPALNVYRKNAEGRRSIRHSGTMTLKDPVNETCGDRRQVHDTHSVLAP